METKKITVDLESIFDESDETILDLLFANYSIDALESTITALRYVNDKMYVEMPFEPRLIDRELVIKHARYWIAVRRRQRFLRICAYAKKTLDKIKHDSKRA